MVIVADAEILSAKSLEAINDVRLGYTVRSMQKEAPNSLATLFTWHGRNTDDGRLIDSLTPRLTVPLEQDRTVMKA